MEWFIIYLLISQGFSFDSAQASLLISDANISVFEVALNGGLSSE